MPSSARLACILLASTLLAAAASPPARAQQAATPDDRCTGTLCDFYYGSRGAEPAPAARPAAPTPLTVPTVGFLGNFFSGGGAAQPAAPANAAAGTPAPGTAAAHRYVQVQGGGLVGMMSGAPPERCTGTLCDLYYGGPPPEQPVAPAAVATDPSVEPDLAPASMSTHTTVAAEREEKPGCAATAQDPWRCYR